MSTGKRRRYFVDRRVQGLIMVKVVVYWFCCVWGAFLILAGFPLVMSYAFSAAPPSPWRIFEQAAIACWPTVLASLLILPLVMRDVARFSNRFVGPILRLRRATRSLAEGQPVAPIRFRDDDHWHELADDFNRVAGRLGQLVSDEAPEQLTDAESEERSADRFEEASRERVCEPVAG